MNQLLKSPARKALLAAKELIRDQAHWTQGESARNSDLQPVSADSSDAICFCLMGAVERCTDDVGLAARLDAVNYLDAAANELFWMDAVDTNDGDDDVFFRRSRPSPETAFRRIHGVLNYAIVLAELDEDFPS